MALSMMTVNHVCNALSEPWQLIGYITGRPCLAVFAIVLTSRLGTDPARALRAILRLLVWGVVAQPGYTLLSSAFGLQLDVLFTLAIGAAAIWLFQTGRHLALAVLMVVVIAGRHYLDGGAEIPLAMFSASILMPKHPMLAVWTIALVSMAGNYLDTPDFWPAALAVLLAVPILRLSRLLDTIVPRLPRLFFYTYYTLHLWLIFLAVGPY